MCMKPVIEDDQGSGKRGLPQLQLRVLMPRQGKPLCLLLPTPPPIHTDSAVSLGAPRRVTRGSSSTPMPTLRTRALGIMG